MPYLVPLDGIRALAVLAVIWFHVAPASLRGGFAGVDVFFVLSGFLITGLIHRDLGAGTFSFREFYLRRIQRLLPNAVVTILAVLLLWTIFLPPSAAIQPATHGLWTLFNLSNFYVWQYLGGYWRDAAESAPLTHFWSLGVEEQFYLLYPVTLVLLARWQRGREKFWLAIVAAASAGACVKGTMVFPAATFYLLPTRMWEFMLGAIIALQQEERQRAETAQGRLTSPRTRTAIGTAGLILVLASFVFIEAGQAFPGWVAFAPTLGTVLLLLSVGDGDSPVARFLSMPFLVWIGKRSYSLYLWHWPLITLGRLLAEFHGQPEDVWAVGGGVAGFLLGWIAWVVVETPLRRRGAGRPWRLATIAAGFAVACLVCSMISARRADVDPDHRFDVSTYSIRLFDAGRSAELNAGSVPATRHSGLVFPPLPPRPRDAWRTGGIVHLHGASQPQIVVLGSSHALMYSRLIDDLCRELSLSVAFLAVDAGTPAFFETKRNPNFPSAKAALAFDAARRKWLAQWRPEAVFVIDRWDGRMGTAGPDVFATRLHNFLAEVTPLSGRVLFVSQVPVIHLSDKVNLRSLVILQMGRGDVLPRLEADGYEPLRQSAVAAAEAARASFPNLRVLRADRPFYREDGSVRYASGRTFYYADGDHLTDRGAEVVRDMFKAALVEAHAAEAKR